MKAARTVYFLLLAIGLAACTSGVHAATYSVMQDGTGDFEEIQPALNAVASGDTLLIGPGEYLESHSTLIPGYPWEVEVFAYVPVSDLTIIGSGVGETIIGPETYEGSTSDYGPKAFVWPEGDSFKLEGVLVRNCYEGVHAPQGSVYIDECKFIDNSIGVIWSSDGQGGDFTNCLFRADLPGGPMGLLFLGTGNGVLVQDCFFDGVSATTQGEFGVTFAQCEFKNAVVSLSVDQGGHCLVRDCRIFDCSSAGLWVDGYSTVCEVEDSEISGAASAIYVRQYAQLVANQSILTGGWRCVVEFADSEESQISDCHLVLGASPAIRSFRLPEHGEVFHDLRNNYWGTEDADEIRALILDGTDDPDNASTVLFEPFAGGPVATEETTLDGLKAMYR